MPDDKPAMASAESLAAENDTRLLMLVARFRQDALAEVYRRHGPACFGLALRIVADRARAEEVVQDVFLRIWNEPEKFDPARGTLRAYVLAHTHGRSVDLVRSETSRRAREERDARERPEPGYDLEREVLDLTDAEHVREAVGELNDGERKAIELAYFDGQTYREVARALGEPEGTVKSRIRAGLGRLRAQLERDGIAP